MATHAPSTGAPTRATSIPALRLLQRHSPQEIADAIEIMIDFLDVLGGDPDSEDSDPPEADDEDEAAYPEWTSLPGSTKRAGHITTDLLPAVPCNHEDAEDEDPDTSVEDSPEGFDPEQDYCTAGDDGVFSGNTLWGVESKWFCADNPGCEDDAEREQMLHDVPTLKVFSAHENIFTDQRQFLGYSNLMTSFRANGHAVVSADSGKRLRHAPVTEDPKTPGAPV